MQPSMQGLLFGLKLDSGSQTSPVSIISFDTMASKYPGCGQRRIVAKVDQWRRGRTKATPWFAGGFYSFLDAGSRYGDSQGCFRAVSGRAPRPGHEEALAGETDAAE